MYSEIIKCVNLKKIVAFQMNICYLFRKCGTGKASDSREQTDETSGTLDVKSFYRTAHTGRVVTSGEPEIESNHTFEYCI